MNKYAVLFSGGLTFLIFLFLVVVITSEKKAGISEKVSLEPDITCLSKMQSCETCSWDKETQQQLCTGCVWR